MPDRLYLHEARREMRELVEKNGRTHCPCCYQNVQKYKRTFNSGMALSLIWLYKNTSSYGDENGFVNIPKVAPREVVRSREFGRIQKFGCFEPKVNEDPTKRCSGWWRITPIGIQFVRREITLPVYLLVLLNRVVGQSKKQHTIVDALGTRFDYRKLMEG